MANISKIRCQKQLNVFRFCYLESFLCMFHKTTQIPSKNNLGLNGLRTKIKDFYTTKQSPSISPPHPPSPPNTDVHLFFSASIVKITWRVMVEFSGSTFCCFAYKETLTTTAVLNHFWTAWKESSCKLAVVRCHSQFTMTRCASYKNPT